MIAAGVAAWPVIAYSVAASAGVDGCVRAHGVVGFIATHGAMMRPVPTCPTQAVGVPPGVDKLLVAVLLGAVVATVVHLGVGIIGTHLSEWIHTMAGAVSWIIAPTLPRVKTFVNVRLSPVGATPRLRCVVTWAAPWRRGPPVRMVPQW